MTKSSELLNRYGRSVATNLESQPTSLSFDYSLQFRSAKVMIITGFVVFRNGWLLEFDEILKKIEIK